MQSRQALLLTLSLLIVPSLAGCSDDAAASRRGQVEALCHGEPVQGGSRELLRIGLEGAHYDLRMPLLVSDEGTSIWDWQKNLGISGDVSAVVEDDGGGTLHIVGRGDSVVASCVLQECCPEAFADATWSAHGLPYGLDDDPAGDFHPVAEEGAARFTYEYEGKSSRCDRLVIIEGTLSRGSSETKADGATNCRS